MNLFTCHRRGKKMFCDICLCACENKTTLAEHVLISPTMITRLRFPPAGSTVKFINHAKAYEPSYLAFYDFESILVEPSSNVSGCVKRHHFAIAYAYIIVNRNGEAVQSGSYCGSNAVNHFIHTMQHAWKKLKFSKGYNKINMTDEDTTRHNEQTHCLLCKQGFLKGKGVKHHDHEKSGNKYIGAYCNRCNLQMKNHKLQLTLIAHNANYDMSLILRELTIPDLKIKLRPKRSVHRYHEVIINDLRFIDSYAFMSGSLAALANQFISNGNEPICTQQMLKDVPTPALPLLIKAKQVFCYDYLDSMERLSETRLPSREDFFNSLQEAELSESDYEHAQNVWKVAGCQSLKDYLLLFVKVDVGLLCDVFLEWRGILKTQWRLDIVNYVSLPGFTYDSFVLKTQQELEVLSSPDIYHCIQTNVRGGYTSVVRRFVRANNIYTNPQFNPIHDRSTFLSYLDFNSLYPTVMQEKLPCGDMRKLDETEMQSFLSGGLVNQATDGDFGYFILCDTEAVSREVVEKTNDLPLIIRRHNITNRDISSVTREWYEEENRPAPCKNIKLIGTHATQEKMLFALPILKLLIQLGLVVKKSTCYLYV
ncbi:uncharacterized protein LOC126995061 isoform X1 [Eriocheir sinensis]|uniref:uncharacterized protein LOC126995061 isoform X1 n=1 Tax=Eriocheir sinensis TaxID=95602 RepID=UPI0021C59CF0|nr:uncharacterized protein LOC126995061 isoform X1 [Eriocheir sinensis]